MILHFLPVISGRSQPSSARLPPYLFTWCIACFHQDMSIYHRSNFITWKLKEATHPTRRQNLNASAIVRMQVKDGRWAYMEVPILPQEHRDLMGADVYGRMRSPWNVNDRPYLTRGLGEMCGELSTDFCECDNARVWWMANRAAYVCKCYTKEFDDTEPE